MCEIVTDMSGGEELKSSAVPNLRYTYNISLENKEPDMQSKAEKLILKTKQTSKVFGYLKKSFCTPHSLVL